MDETHFSLLTKILLYLWPLHESGRLGRKFGDKDAVAPDVLGRPALRQDSSVRLINSERASSGPERLGLGVSLR